MTPAPEATRPTASLAFRQSVVHFDTAKMNPWIGLRNALGVALPLFAGMALHSLSVGVGQRLGALNVAFRDSDAPYLQRARHMLLCSLLMGNRGIRRIGQRAHRQSQSSWPRWALVAGIDDCAERLCVGAQRAESGIAIDLQRRLDPGHAALSASTHSPADCCRLCSHSRSGRCNVIVRQRRALTDLYQELARTAVSAPGQAERSRCD